MYTLRDPATGFLLTCIIFRTPKDAELWLCNNNKAYDRKTYELCKVERVE